MLKTVAAAGLILCAAPALAQPAPAPAQPAPASPVRSGSTPELNASGQAFGECIGARVAALDDAADPDSAAVAILSQCRAEHVRLEQAFETMIAAAPVDEATRSAARQQFTSQLGTARVEIANGIRRARTAPARPGG